MINLYCENCERDKVYRLYGRKNKDAHVWTADGASMTAIGMLGAACRLGGAEGCRTGDLFQLLGFQWLPETAEQYGSVRVPVLRALRDIPDGELHDLTAERQKYSLAVITLSDKGAQGLRKDMSGPEIVRLVSGAIPVSLQRDFLIPDEAGLLKALLADLALNQKYDLICTTGGTGIGPRDITPQATAALLDLELPGFEQAMMAASLAETPNGALSRARAGLIGQSLVINLPGSPKAVRCNLGALLPALLHALEKAGGDTSDCGGN